MFRRIHIQTSSTLKTKVREVQKKKEIFLQSNKYKQVENY